jgi:hypothetical protein
MWVLWWTKRYRGRFSPSTSVSLANHSTDFSIIIITRGWHNRQLSGRSVEWTLIPPPTMQIKKNKKIYPREKGPRYPLDRRSGGPQSWSGRRGEEKIFYPTGTRTRTPWSSSPYLVAIPATLSRFYYVYGKEKNEILSFSNLDWKGSSQYSRCKAVQMSGRSEWMSKVTI